MSILGIDIGGSGIKGALVDVDKGELITDRLRIPTPYPATPKAVIGVVKEMVQHFNDIGPLGVGLPSRVIDGVVRSAANIDDRWIGFEGRKALALATGCPVTLMNDADVAGFAEMRYGAGRGENGVVMIFTLGTGIGSCMFVHGQIVPNLELGHIYLPGHKHDAEFYATDRVRKEEDLSWKKWAKRLNAYFAYIEFLFSPELLIIGGGVSKKHEKFFPYLDVRARLAPAQLRNEAGIVGAAVAAAVAE
jgi:polyphosphate glucokinase